MKKTQYIVKLITGIILIFNMYIRVIAYQIIIKKLFTAYFDIKYKISRKLFIFR